MRGNRERVDRERPVRRGRDHPRRAVRYLAADLGRHLPRVRAAPEDEQFPGLLALRLDGGLFFATTDALPGRVSELFLTSEPPLTAVVLDCVDIPFVDSEGSAKLVELAGESRISVRLARAKPLVLEVLAR